MSGAVEGVALLPCPFCGTDNVALYRPALAKLWAVHCDDCDFKGPTALDKLKASALWNTRTAPPARSYADGVEDAAKVADAGLAQWNEIVASGGVIVAGISITEEEAHVAAGACEALAAAIRLLSQGGKA